MPSFDINDGISLLGTANGINLPLSNMPILGNLKGGTIGSALAGNPVGEAIGQLGMRLAAAGGMLQKGILMWQTDPGSPGFETLAPGIDLNSDVDPADQLVYVPPVGPTFSKFVFPMNPESLQESTSAEWASNKIPGQNRPIYQFVNGGERTLSFRLHFIFDSRKRESVRNYIRTLQSLMLRPQADAVEVGARGRPPLVYFYFGSYIQGERFIITKVNVEMKDLFDPTSLLPMYATVDLTMVEAGATGLGTTGPNNVTLKSGVGSVTDILRRVL